MFIKSDGYSKKVGTNKIIALVLVIIGLSLMVAAVMSPLVEGLLAILLFFMGYAVFETPWNKLTEKM